MIADVCGFWIGRLMCSFGLITKYITDHRDAS